MIERTHQRAHAKQRHTRAPLVLGYQIGNARATKCNRANTEASGKESKHYQLIHATGYGASNCEDNEHHITDGIDGIAAVYFAERADEEGTDGKSKDVDRDD